MDQQSLVTFLFLIASMTSLFSMISLGVFIWFRKAILDRIKLKYLMKYGYIIAELVRNDRTRMRVVVIPNKETNSVRFSGVDGIFTLDDASVTLTDRKWPTYTWEEDECSPVNFGKDTQDSEITCPHCDKTTIVKVKKAKSLAPAVLDNLIMKIKTLAQMKGLNQMLMYILLAVAVSAIIGGVAIFFIDDFKRRFAEIAGPTIYAECKRAVADRMGSILQP